MYFSTIGELIAMDGHGSFVWLAYGTTVLVLIVNLVATRLATRKQESALRWRQEVTALQQQQANDYLNVSVLCSESARTKSTQRLVKHETSICDILLLSVPGFVWRIWKVFRWVFCRACLRYLEVCI